MKILSAHSSRDIHQAANSFVPNLSKLDAPILSTNQSNKKIARKNLIENADQGYFSVLAFATAEEFDLEKLIVALREQDLYITKRFFSSQNIESEPDVLHVTAKYQIENEIRDLYFFREGTVVLWNCNDLEASNILSFLKVCEKVRNFFICYSSPSLNARD